MRRTRFVLLAALVSCSRRNDTPAAPPASASPPAVSVSVAAPVVTPAPPLAPRSVSFSRRAYRGKLGERTRIEAFLQRDGDSISGDYRYRPEGKPPGERIWLSGNVGDEPEVSPQASRHPEGALKWVLTEKTGAKATGTMRLGPTEGGGFQGRWTSADGGRSFPVELEPWGIPPASRAEFLSFAARFIALEKKPPLPRAALEAAIDGDDVFLVHEGHFDELLAHGLTFDIASLYVADVNNDGTKDFVFVDKNSVATHNDMLHGIFNPEGDSLRQLPFDAIASAALFDGRDVGPNMPAYRDDPFLDVAPEGVVMRWTNRWGLDAKGDVVRMIDPCDKMLDEHFVYLWKGRSIRTLAHSKKLDPCR